MFVSEDWTKSKWVEKADGKLVREIVMDSRYWNRVQYALSVFQPLVKVLKMFDAEKELAMSHIYKAMEDAKEEIKKLFGNDEAKYGEYLKIIEDKWNYQLERPLHLAGYYLNLAHFYIDHEIHNKTEFIDAMNQCNIKLNPDLEVQDKVVMDVEKYRFSLGSLGKEMVHGGHTLGAARHICARRPCVYYI
ncbi:uncharacterized protein LOC110006653 isoform X1 [Amborella trichopoda]|uniref:uncharacterized protein LOC110006653 isoform X1 n=1 Tax=Amborella trichopoda TaxID=13333 RepID=UPI0009C04B79|nr:uncharacterized protein LOC110006653 isoform X1 [Amborella trichopoda]|eukprot:XP_020518523.1 uncharacterized protein LOC110006653 isoform X1 [Amborella trichopoda]